MATKKKAPPKAAKPEYKIKPHMPAMGAHRVILDTHAKVGKKGGKSWDFKTADKKHIELGKKLMELTGEKDEHKMRHFMGSRPHGIVAAHLANKPNSEGSLKVLYGRFCQGGYDPMRFCAEGKEEVKTTKDLTDEQWAKVHGQRAGKRGQAHTDNPYEKGTKEHAVWLASHRSGKKPIKEDWKNFKKAFTKGALNSNDWGDAALAGGTAAWGIGGLTGNPGVALAGTAAQLAGIGKKAVNVGREYRLLQKNKKRGLKEEFSKMIREGEDLTPLVQDLIDNGYTEEEIEHYITEGTLLSENLDKLFSSIVDEKPLDASEAINDIITSKLSAAIEDYKVGLAQSMFGGEGGEGDEEDEVDEDNSESSDESDDGEAVADDDGMAPAPDDADLGINFEDMTDEQLAEIIADAESDDVPEDEIEEGENFQNATKRFNEPSMKRLINRTVVGVKADRRDKADVMRNQTYKGTKMKTAPNGQPFKEDTELTEMSAAKKAAYAAAAAERIANKSGELGALKQKLTNKRGKGTKAFYNTKARKADAAKAQAEIERRKKGVSMATRSMRNKTPRGRGKRAH